MKRGSLTFSVSIAYILSLLSRPTFTLYVHYAQVNVHYPILAILPYLPYMPYMPYLPYF